jgi:anti-anti-sigma factor
MNTPAAVPLTITARDQDQRRILVLAGDLDAGTAPQFAEAALALVNEGVRDIFIEMSGLTMCDSSGLSVLVELASRLRAQAGRLAIVAPPDTVRRVLDVGGVGATFVVAPTVAGAIYTIHRDHP